MNRLIAVATGFLAPSLALAATFAGVEVPPPPAPRPVYDTHWGVRIEDPYRFLETTTDPEVQKYMRAQADATTAILARIPGRDSLLARIREIDEATPATVNSVVRDDRGGIFYLKREAKDNQFKLYRRESPASAEVLLVDPEIESKAQGSPHAIGEIAPSRDGRFVAYVMSAGGAEIGTLRVIETATGKEVTPRIDRIRGGSPSWLPDGGGFFYSRLAEGYEKRPRAERFLDEKAWFRRLAEPGKDFAVFGAGMHFEVGIERAAGSYLVVTPGQDHVAAIVFHGVDPNLSVYLAELAAVLEGKPRWRKIIGRGDQVSQVAAGGGWLYAMTARDAPRFRVVATKMTSPDISDVRTVIAAGDEVVVGMAASSEGLYVTRRRGAAKELLRIAHGEGSAPQRISLPFEGNVNVVDAQSHRPGAVLTLGGWTRAARHYAIGPSDEAPAPLPLAPEGKYDAPANLVSREVRVKSHDGVEVPVSIVHRADAKLDGGNPAMLYGYGAYGIVEDPAFNPRLLAWLEAGGVFAVAHVRGGGIFGDGWRRAGWKTTKHNTWKDGIAAAEWLVTNGYTTPSRLAVYGGSAGGIFVGRAITERPDLFSSAIIAVGNTDSLRSETRANGVGNMPEYGTFTREDEFRGLLAMSPYANVKPGTAYPAVMFEHGVNDSRVDVWMTLKTGSRFAAATTSGKPVLMRLEFESGHGPGATRAQSQATTADRWAFMLWQARDARFQPSP